MRHLGANFFSQFRNKDLMNLFKKLCKQNQEWKYTKICGRLNIYTQKHVRDKRMHEQQLLLVMQQLSLHS